MTVAQASRGLEHHENVASQMVKDFSAALETASGIGLPFGSVRWIWLRNPFLIRCSSFFAEL
jgi:hypothetical protein